MSPAVCRIAVCVLAVLTVGPILRADEKDEWKGLKGTWNIEKAISKGADQSTIFKSFVLTIDEGKYTLNYGAGVDKGTLKIDAAAKPRRLTITGTDGPSKGKTIEAIYEVDGDALKICYAIDGKDPPKEFESKEGTQTLFVVYKRGKPAEKK